MSIYDTVRRDRRDLDQSTNDSAYFPTVRLLNYNVITPLDYWTNGSASAPAMNTELRVDQLRMFRTLYNGDLDPILGSAFQVRVNWFRRMSTQLADLFMAFAPEIIGVDDDDGEVLHNDLIEAVYGVIIDQTRYGVGILRGYVEDGMPRVESVNPETWYPAGGGSDAIVVPGAVEDALNHHVVTLMRPGRIERLVMSTAGSGVELREVEGSVYGVQLGGVLEREVFDLPEVVERTIFPCPRRALGSSEWGESLYIDMVPLVAEYCKRMSATSDLLDRHANPLLMLTQDERRQGYNDANPSETEAAIIGAQRIYLDRMREMPVAILPPEFTDAKYVFVDLQMQGVEMHMKHLENALYASTQVPASLYGTLESGVSAVGNVSLKKAYAPTYAFLRRAQTQVTHRIRGAVRVALALAGRSTEFDIAWPNAIEEFDKNVQINLNSMGGEEETDGVQLPDDGGSAGGGDAERDAG